MYHHMDGNWASAWDWLWLALMIVFWLAVLGGVVYVAVRLALEHQQQPPLEQ